ncbi:hypothetical protein N7520_011818 [Penicillium odoratum]|uniref:uncharacterized protein n=1 Tax=Penicillium odoratum TaxID=1167516 RepID=UPI002548D8A1|nr:uncharacterized protein N7520_011818 [Penicillium odoratum]KAJ5746636.1 hypothetical protein N7520_011818 [Penicillium odoratum]
MAICITFGTHEFTSMLEGYENVRAYCYNCRNWNGHCITRCDRTDITPDTRPPVMPNYQWGPPGPQSPPQAHGGVVPQVEAQKGQPPPQQHGPVDYK